MPLQLYNLDDRSYKELVAEAISMLPRYAQEWTDHNPSDPGITLIELLAYFTETMIYRLNKVTCENKIKFLQLLQEVPSGELERLGHASVGEVDEALKRAVLELAEPQRAVTLEDYEKLALAPGRTALGGTKVARALGVARKDLDAPDDAARAVVRNGEVSLVVVPEKELAPRELRKLLEELKKELEPKRLITTRLHVVGPCYLWVFLRVIIATSPDAKLTEVGKEIVERVEKFFDPLPGGGPKGDGWPFGRAIHLSEVYEQCQRVEGVDYVEAIHLMNLSTRPDRFDDDRTAVGIQPGLRSTVGVDSRLGCETESDSERLILDSSGRLIGIALRQYELVKIKVRLVPVGA